MGAPDHGTAEADRRLTMEFARATAERIAAAEEQQQKREAEHLQKMKKEHNELEKARNEAKRMDTTAIEIGSEAICHVIGGEETFTGIIAKIDNSEGTIAVRNGKEDMVFRREKVYFSEPPTQAQKRGQRIAELDEKLNNPPYWQEALEKDVKRNPVVVDVQRRVTSGRGR